MKQAVVLQNEERDRKRNSDILYKYTFFESGKIAEYVIKS